MRDIVRALFLLCFAFLAAADPALARSVPHVAGAAASGIVSMPPLSSAYWLSCRDDPTHEESLTEARDPYSPRDTARARR